MLRSSTINTSSQTELFIIYFQNELNPFNKPQKLMKKVIFCLGVLGLATASGDDEFYSYRPSYTPIRTYTPPVHHQPILRHTPPPVNTYRQDQIRHQNIVNQNRQNQIKHDNHVQENRRQEKIHENHVQERKREDKIHENHIQERKREEKILEKKREERKREERIREENRREEQARKNAAKSAKTFLP